MRRISPELYAKITFVALAALVIIIVTGGAVRLTGSGLGCPDWPTCANNHVVAPWERHALVEFTNRVFTGLVVVAVAAGVLGSLLRNPRRRDLTWLSVTLVVGVFAQAVLGGLAVLWDLDPRFVMAHFMLSQVIVFAAVVLHHRASQPDGPPKPVVDSDYVVLARAVLFFAFVVLFLGTIVTGAGPHAGSENVRRLGFAPHDVTKLHASFVWLLVAFSVLTLWRLNVARAPKKVVRRGELMMLALLVQGAIGYLQYSLDVPPALVLLHIAGATAVWIAAIAFNLSMYERWEDVGLAAYDGPVDLETLTSLGASMEQEPPPPAQTPPTSEP